MKFFKRNQTYLPVRDSSKDRKYWDKFIKQYEKLIIKNTILVGKPNKLRDYDLAICHYDLVRLNIRLLIASYSRGDDLKTIRIIYTKVIEAIERLRNLPFLVHDSANFDSLYTY